MDLSLAWLIAGFILVIAELVTGTFYLLVLGVAAFVGAGVAYFGGHLLAQAVVAAVFAVVGTIWVHRYRHALGSQRMRGLDVGQPGACRLRTRTGRVRRRISIYLMTLSARASRFGGIVKPICLAVLRLIMSSNFVGCSTGRSPGFLPFRILST